jgi:hypothetical protein
LFLTLTMMAVVTFVFAWLFAHDYRERLMRLLAPTALAYGVTVIICVVFLYYALARGSGYSIGAGYTYVSDALNFFIPTRITWLGGHLFDSVTTNFTGELGEQGAYLGLPLIAMLLIYFVQARRTVAARILLGVIVVAGVWSLGAKLHVKGPTRLDLLPATNATYPGTQVAAFHAPVSQPRLFTTREYRSFLRPNEDILPLPWANQGQSMLWQADANFSFRMASGHFGAPPATYMALPIVRELRANRPERGAAPALRSFISAHGVGAIVQDPRWSSAWTPILKRLGLRGVPAGGVVVYRVPPRWLSGAS